MTTWTNDQRIAFNALCQTPVMQEAIAELERRIQVRPPTTAVAPGYDELVLGAGQYHRAIGHREVLDHIADMCRELKPVKQLPPPNTAEALARNNPKP